MSTKHVQPGTVIPVLLAAAVTVNSLVKIGTLVGVALTAGGIGDTISCAIVEVYTVAKLATDVIAQGDLLYLDDTNHRMTSTASGNTLGGRAFAAAGNGVTTVQLLLNV